MVLTFQVILLAIILGTGIGATVEKEDRELRNDCFAVFISANATFIASVIWL